MVMQTDINGMEHQAVTVPGPTPQRGPLAATGKVNQQENRRQQAKSLSRHPEMSAGPLDTDNSKNINASVLQLIDCILQAAKRATPEAEGRTTSLTGITTYSASMTNSLKPEYDLSSSLRQSTPFSTTRQGLLLPKKRTRKPASHGKKRLAHSTWRTIHRSSGI